MQEIAILLSSIAGACTAAAIKKIPKKSGIKLQSLSASSQIRNQINTLKIEKEILTKTITRLYQTESEISNVQRDKLLLRYQHQLGLILAKIEKLEAASQHPDLGPVGDGLITLMDQKLSQLDNRLYELSSKITASMPSVETQEKREYKEKERERKESKDTEQEQKIVKKFKEPRVDTETVKTTTAKPVITTNMESQPSIKTARRSFEFTTLTDLSRHPLKQFPEIEKNIPKREEIEETSKAPQPKTSYKDESVKPPQLAPETDKQKNVESVVTSPKTVGKEQKPDIIKISTQKALPPPKQQSTEGKKQTTYSDDEFDDSDDDLDKIKGEIMRTLSKLEQAEVE